LVAAPISVSHGETVQLAAPTKRKTVETFWESREQATTEKKYNDDLEFFTNAPRWLASSQTPYARERFHFFAKTRF
jgi:hypothetical protein